MRKDYVEYHLKTNEEVWRTRHVMGEDYVKLILSDMSYFELYGTDVFQPELEVESNY